jgi:hypothetical protein
MKPSVATANPDASMLASLSIDEVAFLAPSAIAFQRLLGDEVSDARVSRQDGALHIEFARRGASTSGLRSASLILNGRSLTAIEETLVIGRNGDDREIHFIESQREVEEIDSLPPAIFSPDPESLTSTADSLPSRLGPIRVIDPLVPPEVAVHSQVFAVVSALDSVQALLGEQIEIRRTPEGALRVEGFVEEEQRLQLILAALKPATRDTSVQLALRTFHSATDQSVLPRRLVQREFAVAQRATEAELELEHYFAQRGIEAAVLNDEVRRFREQVQYGAREARQHARALLQIVQWLPQIDLSPLQAERWKEMIRAHAVVCMQSAVEINRLATPYLGPCRQVRRVPEALWRTSFPVWPMALCKSIRHCCRRYR